MWKLLVGFIVFAAVALFVLKKAGGDIDMGGEKHGIEVHSDTASAPASAAVVPVPAASVPASAASN